MAESFWSQLENTIGAERLKPSCVYDDLQAEEYKPVVDIDTWRQNASIEDWKKYLLQGPELCTEMTRVQNTANVSLSNSHGTYVTCTNNLNGGYTPAAKRKRKRTMFTTEQVGALEKVFYANPYINREVRLDLEKTLKVNEKAIKVWFQNRRLKEKKEKKEHEYDPNNHPLTYVESLSHKADQFGFVKLDDKAISELVAAIDDFLPKDLTVFENTNKLKTESRSSVSSESSVMYEPISPPDLTGGSSEDTAFQNWTNFESIEPRKVLERLFDAHSL